MNRIGRPPPVASYFAALRASRNGAMPCGQPDVEDVCIGIDDVPRDHVRSPGLRPSAFRCAVYDTAERLDQEDDIVAQSIRDRRELNATRPPLLGDRTTIGVEETPGERRAVPRVS